MEIFFAYKGTEAAARGGTFSFFSLPHILWLILCAAGIAAFMLFYRRGGENRKSSMRNGMALFLILFEIAKQCALALTGAPVQNHLPLEICSFAEYTILIDALWPKNRFFKQLLAFSFLPGTCMALLLPTATAYPPINFYTLHHFALHAGVAAYILARYVAGEIRPHYKGLWLTTAAMLLLVVPIYLIDNAFGVNFMLLADHFDNPALKLIWDLTGGTGGIPYVAGLGVLVIGIFHIAYALYAVAGKKHRPKSEP